MISVSPARCSRQLALLAVGIVLLAAVGGSTTTAAHAQLQNNWVNPYTGNRFNNPLSSSLDTMILHSQQQHLMKRTMLRSALRKKGYGEAQLQNMSEEDMMRALGGKGGNASAAASKTPSAPAAKKPAIAAVPATRFQPSGKRLLLGTFADSLGKTDEEKKSYRQIFTQVFDAYEAEAKKRGLANDVAAAMAFYTMTNYSLYHSGDASEAAAAEKAVDTLAREFRSAMDSPDFRKTPNPEKQKLYESFVLLSAYMLTLQQVASGQNDPEVNKALVKLGGEGLKYLLKVAPERVKLTESGLTITPEAG